EGQGIVKGREESAIVGAGTEGGDVVESRQEGGLLLLSPLDLDLSCHALLLRLCHAGKDFRLHEGRQALLSNLVAKAEGTFDLYTGEAEIEKIEDMGEFLNRHTVSVDADDLFDRGRGEFDTFVSGVSAH